MFQETLFIILLFLLFLIILWRMKKYAIYISTGTTPQILSYAPQHQPWKNRWLSTPSISSITCSIEKRLKLVELLSSETKSLASSNSYKLTPLRGAVSILLKALAKETQQGHTSSSRCDTYWNKREGVVDYNSCMIKENGG